MSGTLSISEVFRVVWQSGSNYGTNVVQREVSIEVKNKARPLEVTRIISRSPEQRLEVQMGLGRQ